MWAEGIFGEPFDTLIFAAAFALSIFVLWRLGRRAGANRISEAKYWLACAMLILPTVLIGGMVGLWIGVIISELVPFAPFRIVGPLFGGTGIMLIPALLSWGTGSALAVILLKPRPAPST
jgi:hypothetical protein